MAGKTDKFEYDFVKLVFNGSAISNVAATAGTTSWWLGLMTADPTEAGSTANEGGYTAYTRVQTDRSTQATTPYGWAVSSGTVGTASPVGTLSFPAVGTTSTGTFTHFMLFPSSAAQASSGLYFGTVTPNINFSNGVTPQLTTGSAITED